MIYLRSVDEFKNSKFLRLADTVLTKVFDDNAEHY